MKYKSNNYIISTIHNISSIAVVSIFSLFLFSACNTNSKENYKDVQIAGNMRAVMWNGELAGKISLDTLNKSNLYGLGPLSFLKGELLLMKGRAYSARFMSDSTMKVEEFPESTAPFFVYAEVNTWEEQKLPVEITNLQSLENYLTNETANRKRPFAFKLNGTIKSATIHLQNLPEGSKVSSPQEAHQGQINYELKARDVEILGFFSTEHKGIFTHHDSFIHLHLITKDKQMMGHLDEVEFDNMQLYLPIN